MIEAINLTKKIDNSVVLNNIDLIIPDSCIFGLVGSNGSGKSTFLRVISGVYMSDGGEAKIDGENIFDNNEIKKKICYLSDTPYFIHQSNLNEMIRFYKMFYPDFSDEKFERLNKAFPLDRKKRISTMSKGMQRQAALMLSLASEPEYLFLDEAFDGLDAVMRKVLKSLLAERVADGKTTIIASHNLRELEELCDTVGLLHNGSILYNDRLDKIKDNIHKIQVVFSRVPDISVFDSLDVINIQKTGSVVSLVARGDENEIVSFINKLFPILVEVIEPTFEEVFMYELEANGYDTKNIIE